MSQQDYESKLKVPLKELINFGKGRNISAEKVKQLAQWFVNYDKTGDGLELPEMKLIFKTMLNRHVSESIVDRWCTASFDKSDKDKSGHLEILEFLDLYLDFNAQFEEPERKRNAELEKKKIKEAENATNNEYQHPTSANHQEENDENQEDIPHLNVHEQQDIHEQQEEPPLNIQQNHIELPQPSYDEQEPPQNTEQKQEPPQNTEQKQDEPQKPKEEETWQKKQEETKTHPEPEKKHDMKNFSDDDIRTRAYYIWVRNGQANGRDEEFWFQAISELQRESQNGDK